VKDVLDRRRDRAVEVEVDGPVVADNVVIGVVVCR
jgi:hypothetical protein